MQIPHIPDEWLRAILVLYYETRELEICGIGNAVIVAASGDRALALTAAHVAEEINRRAAKDSPFRDLLTAREANPRFISRVNTILGERHCDGEQDVVLIPEASIPTHGGCDIATANVMRSPNGRYPFEHRFGLKLLPPSPGEKVCVIGGYGQKRRPDLDDDTSRQMFELQACVLPATVVSETREGDSLAPGPVFQVDVDFEAGLSGAPVLIASGERLLLCGVVSAGGSPSGQGTVAAIWPALALEVKEKQESSEPSSRRTLFELATRGAIGCDPAELARFAMVDGNVYYRVG